MAYKFQIITDTRFRETKKRLQQLDRDLKLKISKMDGVKLIVFRPIYEIDFSKELGESCKQWRVDYKVVKTLNKYSWNDIFREINSIGYAPYYIKF
jgi:hypothetical protein